MNTDPNVPQGLDPTAFYLTKAIRQTETSGSANAYTTPGKSGEYGAYQYTPGTWNTDAEKYLGQGIPLDKATPEQQNKVAYSKVADLLKHHSQSEVASIWNSGYSDPNIIGTGTNKEGVSYDVPGYVEKVKKNYLSYAQGNNQQSGGGYIKSTNVPADTTSASDPQQEEQKPGMVQGLIQGITSPVLSFASSGRGIYDALTGNNEGYDMGNKEGYDYGYFGKVKPVGGGANILTGSPGEAMQGLLSAAGTGAKIGIAAGTLGAGSSLFAGADAVDLAAPIVGIPEEQFASLGAADKLDLLDQAYNGATASQKMVLDKAIAKLGPMASKELGLEPTLATKIFSKLGSGAWRVAKVVARSGLDIAGLETLRELFK